MENNILTVSDLIKIYNHNVDPVIALRGVNLELTGSSSVALIGPSGSGKTTFLNILMGLIPKTAGKIHLLGNDFDEMNDFQRKYLINKKIGFSPQNPNTVIYPNLTASENILLSASLHGVKLSDSQCAQILRLFALEEKQNQLAGSLSMGERVRLSISMAISHNPELILLDEPSSLLDTQNVKRLGKYLEAVKSSGKSILVTTHDPRFMLLADYSYLLIHGRIASRKIIRKNRLELRERTIGLIDKGGFVQIPENIRMALGLTSLAIFELTKNNDAAIIRNPTPHKQRESIEGSLFAPIKEILRKISTFAPKNCRIKVQLRRYPRSGRLPILYNSDLEFLTGEVNVIIGPSGSGKTTLLSIVANQITAYDGFVFIENTPLPKTESILPPEVFFIPDFPTYNPQCSIKEQLEATIQKKPKGSQELYQRYLKSLAKFLRVEHLFSKYFMECSAGERQRVALIDGLLYSPKFLIIDEPSSHLDEIMRNRVTLLLNSVANLSNVGVVFSTHDPSTIMPGNHVFRIQDGKMASEFVADKTAILNLRKEFLNVKK